ncbi:Rha family transcriptional regulator [Pseudomonas chlororaphis]|nr:Rha family transcriptional regulator [Pseudomonas chlororaphis]
MTITPFTGGDAVTMTSQEIADLVGKRHDNVKRTIETLASSGVIVRPQIEDEPGVDTMGRERITQVYRFEGAQGKRDSIIVVAQLCPEFTADLVDRWQKLEQQVQQQVQVPALPGDYIQALEHLLESKRSEKLAIEQRDRAIETKAQIGARREATAMATASHAVRQVRQLKNELGRGLQQATVAAVEKVAKRKFGKQGFRPLKAWCAANGVQAPKVHDPRYGWVRSWPAAAWMDVYQIDLADLFGADGDSHE